MRISSESDFNDMKITEKEVKHIATLARLKLTKEETEMFGGQLNDILNYMEKLNELETDNIAPTAHVIPLKNIFREDIKIPSLDKEETLSNAPDRNTDFYRVPKIID